MLDAEVRERFKKFQNITGKHKNLDINDVLLEEISLADDKYFEFIKGKNHYIKKYNLSNKGEYPLATGSVKNASIAYHVKPINNSDIVIKKCISFNKDGDSQVFYRDYDFLMDRHHIAIVPTDNILAKYLYFSIIPYFRKMKFGWGENVADVPTVSKHYIPIPKGLDKTYTSLKIQEAIAEFLEFWKDGYTDVIREKVLKKKPIYEAIRRIVIKNTFQYDKFLVARFNHFVEDNNYDIKLENIQFKKISFFNLVNVTNGAEFPSGYVKRIEVKGKIPLISAGVKKDVMGYIKSLKGNKNDEPDSHYVFNNTKNKWNKVHHYIGKDFYTLNADGEGGHIIKRSTKDYPKGFYTTNVCKVLEFDREKTIEKYFYFSYQSVKDKENFGFLKKANNENLAKVDLLLPIENEKYTSKEIQQLLVEFWEMIIEQIDDKLKNYKRMLELTNIIDRAFLYRTFSKIDWSKE